MQSFSQAACCGKPSKKKQRLHCNDAIVKQLRDRTPPFGEKKK
jgi:hypothetical protein